MNAPASLRAAGDARAVLADPAASLAQVMAAVEAVEAQGAPGAVVKLGISAGATIELLGLYLRRHALLAGVRLEVVQGNFDDPLGDLARFAAQGVEAVVLAPFFDTLGPAFEAEVSGLAEAEVEARAEEVAARWSLALRAASGLRSVVLADFHRLGAPVPGGDRVDAALARFNALLRREAAQAGEVRVLDMGALIASVGRRAALDLRFYLRNAAPYTPALLDAWARQVCAATRAFGTRYYKALVLDGDNTLWGGIVGEDGPEGIKLDPHSYPGAVFWRAQLEFRALQRQGVLLCLCSKNDPQAVDALLESHPHMALRDADIVHKRVNWDDKVSNLQALAGALNIGLDSLVFLDDSAFECEAVRRRLPEVTVFQVPAAPPDYLNVVAEIRALFLAGGAPTQGAAQTQAYRVRAEAETARVAFDSHEAYLASLELRVGLALDQAAHAPRVAELSQKTNQFNLTTVRYSAAEVERLMADPGVEVWSAEVADRFGPSGLTGVVVLRYADGTCSVESLFVSCRVLGRGVELSVWDTLYAAARARGATRLEARYRPTAKNAQAADFYDRLGLTPVGGGAYEAALAELPPPKTPWIEVSRAG